MKALWNLGFRPFFLFGAAWSGLQILVWVAFQSGWIGSVPYSDPLIWHAHEMIFGYSVAIIAGFILTASQNWTGIPGVQGNRLKVLVLLWGVARILSIFWTQARVPFAIFDLAFIPALAWSLKPYLWQKSQNQNKVFFLLLMGLFLLNLAVHLDGFAIRTIPARSALLGAIYVAVIMIAVVAGRVIPFFTGVVIPTAKPVQSKAVEVLSFSTLVIFTVFATVSEFSLATAALAFLAAILQTIRWLLWRPWKSIRVPILLILYVAYAWIPLGLMFRGMAAMGWMPASIATHAFTAGCIGTMIYGMITRVALGHSGRPIRPKKIVIFGYWIISFAALARVFGPWMFPNEALTAFEISGYLWVLAHLIFVVVYGPILWSPRPDGKKG